MAYVQKNNPIPKTACGRRRSGGVARGAFKKVDVQALEEVSKQLEKASNTHAGQAKKIKSALPKIKRTKISAPCKAAAKRKFKVWPSAYASGWGVRCTRNPSKYLKRK
jgi:hypothetical protein